MENCCQYNCTVGKVPIQLIAEFTFVMYACKKQSCDDKSGNLCKKRKIAINHPMAPGQQAS
ncbi:hypothetical protein T4D_1358 [Trichinella pseudospiralis]|uniref:Uncharacterized protein n=1 Tax=Trichinella pseudospiralis TaxID=6337 RepID=A0A0V1FI83_TRIPS|nr:hypothetical protein T4D_1358 [Trichinella pseudospiralis]